MLAEVERFGYDEASVFSIKLALEEGLNNACRHGNGFDQNKKVYVAFDVTAQRCRVSITDEGEGFDPDNLPDPTADENLEKPSGRGVMLMRVYMDEVTYNDKGNQVVLIKRNAPTGQAGITP